MLEGLSMRGTFIPLCNAMVAGCKMLDLALTNFYGFIDINPPLKRGLQEIHQALQLNV